MTTGTNSWFPFPQFLGDGWAEFLAPVTDGFMLEFLVGEEVVQCLGS